MLSFPEYGSSGELPLEAYGLTEADVDGEMPDAVAELHDAATQAEIEAAWAVHDAEA